MEKDIQNHLNRIEGQLAGIRKMITEQRPCTQTIQQIIAVRSSLSSIGKRILKAETKNCIKNENKEQLSALLDQLFKIS